MTRFGCTLALALGLLGAPATAATFVYVHDRGPVNQVYAFSLAKDGALAPVAGSPFGSSDPDADPCGGLCQTMAADKKSARLFTSGGSGITSWNVAEDGGLVAVAGSPFGATGTACDGGPCRLLGVAALRVGKRLFVYAAEFDQDRLRGFEAQADGSLAELPASPFAACPSPNGIAGAKTLLFATCESGSVASYVVGEDGTPTPAPGSPLDLDPAPIFVFNAVPDAKGKLLYVVDDGFDDANDANDVPVSVYTFGVDKKTAALAPLAGSPFPTSLPPNTVDAATGASTAKKLVVAAGFEAVNDDLQVFKIGKGGAPASLGAAQDSGLNVQAHVLDPKGKWLLAASNERIRVYGISAKTGLVTPVAEQEFPADTEANAILLLKP
jgi:hypothetical protein